MVDIFITNSKKVGSNQPLPVMIRVNVIRPSVILERERSNTLTTNKGKSTSFIFVYSLFEVVLTLSHAWFINKDKKMLTSEVHSA